MAEPSMYELQKRQTVALERIAAALERRDRRPPAQPMPVPGYGPWVYSRSDRSGPLP